MRVSRFSALVLALAFPAIGCDDTSTTEDTGVADTGGTDSGDLDSGTEVTDTGGETDAPVALTCGTAQPDVSGIRGTEGLVIGRDGTIFYSQSGGVGRMTPDGTQDDDWVDLGAGTGTVWGLALDAANETLYVGSPSAGRVFAVTVSTGAVATFVASAGGPNGLTVGPDGALYFSDFSGGAVRRATAGGMTTVTTSSIPQANGVAFDAEGRLIVLSYGTGRLLRLTLIDGVETSREPMVAMGLGSPDGVTLDANGDFWVTDNSGSLRHVIAATGANTNEMSGISAAASVDFGAGPLDCHDIYIASSGAVRVFSTGVEGADVLWH